MTPYKLPVIFCLCGCLVQIHPFDWRDLGPIKHIKSTGWYHTIESLMSTSLGDEHQIPKGKGSYSVGCTDLMFDFTAKGSLLRLYYPSQDDEYHSTLWIPSKEYFLGVSNFLGLRKFMGKFIAYIFGSVTTPANWNAPLRTGEKYPLIIFSHGLGAFRTIYSAIGIDLASHGFIIAAVEHRDESASATFYFENEFAVERDNKSWIPYRHLHSQDMEYPQRHKQVLQRAEECSKALNLMLDINDGKTVKNVLHSPFDLQQLKDAIDGKKIAVMGHSFGGATVIQSLGEDKRFQCGIALDAWMVPLSDELYSRVPQPLFFINSERFQTPENVMKMKKFYLPDRERKMITIKGSVHQNFPDFTFVTGKVLGHVFSLKGDIDSDVAIDLSNKASLAFLQKHLDLQRNFNQWDHLIEGEDINLIPDSNAGSVTYLSEHLE
ncbi:platelet-activating factor acetylhydrolase [Phascolarctos cinereus]|uniref:Platelet-activating factor acetylhydrolase n=1 Tax=Phascolarctos cinereus TaxID=38626 RepID=A0A6P5KYD3_PHACI|nr:platelet-activating factor acetylhydrolase [Phascolarctos cinereus]XP_020849594.1 platelet-activating factor acetylhydrolase [Phascolarctos cinereus]